jgi:hypothetical protein
MAITLLNNGDTGLQAREIINALGDVAVSGSNYIFVPANGTDTENAAALQATYEAAVASSPTGTNRITIVAAPGYYNFETTPFIMDTEYIDLVSLDGNPSIIFNSGDDTGTIQIQANNVFIKGVDVQTKPFTIAINNATLLKVENCKGGDFSFGEGDGATGIVLSGTFNNCTAGDNSFGASVDVVGTFNNCTAGHYSFGNNVDVVGTFNNCTAGDNSFGYFSDDAVGTFNNCTAGNASFGAGGRTSGTFNNCTAGDNSFSGILTGKLYYCRLIQGGFVTVSGAGKTRLCIDGLDAENNQG